MNKDNQTRLEQLKKVISESQEEIESMNEDLEQAKKKKNELNIQYNQLLEELATIPEYTTEELIIALNKRRDLEEEDSPENKTHYPLRENVKEVLLQAKIVEAYTNTFQSKVRNLLGYNLHYDKELVQSLVHISPEELELIREIVGTAEHVQEQVISLVDCLVKLKR